MSIESNIKVGYALGGGAARGLSHIGVLKVLEKNNIFPDIITGTSMGALVGALYAGGISVSDIERLGLGLDFKRLVLLADFTLPSSGLMGGKRVISLLKSIMGDLTFSQLKRDFACVATDIITGEQVVLHEGSLIEAVRASISLPGIFNPVNIKGRYLVDGGLVNEVPVSVCREMGADYVIGVNVIPEPSKMILKSNKSLVTRVRDSGRLNKIKSVRKPGKLPNIPTQFLPSRIDDIEKSIRAFLTSKTRPRRKDTDSPNKQKIDEPKKSKVKMPSLLDIISQTLTIAEYRVAIENLKDADLAISPNIEDIGFWQFDKAAQAIAVGENAANLAIQ